jgi:hypothetical protein
MNQKQREFLIKRIETTAKEMRDRLNAERPRPPSLNNYVIAAILDGSIELQPFESIQRHVKELVLRLGPSDALVNRRRDRWHDEDTAIENEITLDAEQLFILPGRYREALAEYEIARADWERRADEAEAVKETLILKIQIGSDAVLNRLIEQVDNLHDLQVVNSRLLLTTGSEG